jgi:chaperone modulatory protein CbpM
MRTIQEIVALEEVSVDQSVIEEWIELEWLKPVKKKRTYYFEEIDVARIHLIYELQYRMTIERDAMPLVLSLLDQLYGTRARLQKLVNAIEQQPQRVQSNIFSLLSGDEGK